MSNTKKVVWFVSSLEQRGGGERFVMEGAQAIRELGYTVTVICDRLSNEASFDGKYDLSKIICTDQQVSNDISYLSKVMNKLKGLFSLYSAVKNADPSLIICQSEFDAIKAMIISKLIGCAYRVFIFGQMFQFKTDISRYSIIFRKHLETIRNSRPGYADTVMIPGPRLNFVVRLVNEAVSAAKYVAMRRSDKLFVLSNQVKWEVSLLYQRDSSVLRASFHDSYLVPDRFVNPRLVTSPAKFMTVSRLVDKKRIDLIIRAFAILKSESVLTIIGSGPESENLKKLVAELGVDSSVRFLGSIDDEHLISELEMADCFISMDIGDFDISVVEAMGKGIRVIVATDFDLSAFGSDFSGVLASPPDHTLLAESMQKILTMPAPSVQNINVLKTTLTWQSFGKACIS